MLAQLISARQVVLLCDSKYVYLFYCGQVYSRVIAFGFNDLPERRKVGYCPIWALVDVDYGDQGPPIENDSNIWPIQASSPNPIRWKAWQKQNEASLLGMPLWSKEDLMGGCVFGLFSLSADPGDVVR